MTEHVLPLDAAVLHGRFSRELPPVLTVEPGDSVKFSTPNAGWRVGRDEPLESRRPDVDTGHALAGPIEVRGARAGQVLAVTVDEVVPGPWGVTFGGETRLDWELADGVGPGSTLFLPIAVDGARFSAGDGHAAQGDGEVSGTAIEAPVTAQVTLDVRDDLELEWPVARVDGAWLTFGFDEHLGRAARIAVDGLLDLMEREHGLARGEATAFASVVADLRVTQVVNEVLGVHAVLRDDAFL